MHRLLAFAAIVFAACLFGCAQPTAKPADGTEAFALACAHCHASGLAGVPAAGVPDDWNTRDAKDFEVLLERVVAGHGNMPPLGSCPWCSESELRAAIALMVAGSEIEVDAR